MQDFKTVTSDFSVAGILKSGDMEKIKSMGFTTVISNLPDEEVTNGFSSDIAKSEAHAAGLHYFHMPANGATVTDQDVVDKFADILATADQPILAHCKSGTRSAILWSMVASRSIHPDKVIADMEKIGFELDFLDDEFEEQWELAAVQSKAPLPMGAKSIQSSTHGI